MSAYIVGRASIDALVHAGAQWDLWSKGDLDGLGRVLWSENVASVAYRYPEDGDGDRPGPTGFRDADAAEYVFRPTELLMEPDAILAVIGCYLYQSCEHPSFTDSVAYRFCDELRTKLREAGATEDDDLWDLQDITDAAAGPA